MTTGIYQLTFDSGDTYVGQARDILSRYKQHLEKLSKGAAATKMQQAFNGVNPYIEELIICHPDYLDIMESYFIHKYSPTLNSTIPEYRGEEAEILLSNPGILETSPAEVVSNLRTALEHLVEIQTALADKTKLLDNRLLHLRVEAELKDGKDYNASRVLALERQLLSLTLTIDVLYKRPLLQRILNSRV